MRHFPGSEQRKCEGPRQKPRAALIAAAIFSVIGAVSARAEAQYPAQAPTYQAGGSYEVNTGYPQQPYPPQAYPQQGYPQQPYPPQAYPQQGYPQQGYPQQPSSGRTRADWEIGVLYGVGALYGAGMGVWVSTELDIDDPGIFLIAPAVLALAGPVGVYFLDHPKMKPGLPMAITTGMVIGTGNAAGTVIFQHASQPASDAWGFHELTRSIAIGSTVGAAGGYAAGIFLEPPPASGLLVTSGVLWGSAIGGMFGYGASTEKKSYHEANENIALGGLIGLNVGWLATGALTSAYAPSLEQVGSMWIGGAIGAAISAPVYLLYIGDDKPPVRRGLLFTGTTTTLGLIGGAVFGSGKSRSYASSEVSDAGVASLGSWGKLDYVMPTMFEGGAGLGLGGRLE